MAEQSKLILLSRSNSTPESHYRFPMDPRASSGACQLARRVRSGRPAGAAALSARCWWNSSSPFLSFASHRFAEHHLPFHQTCQTCTVIAACLAIAPDRLRKNQPIVSISRAQLETGLEGIYPTDADALANMIQKSVAYSTLASELSDGFHS